MLFLIAYEVYDVNEGKLDMSSTIICVSARKIQHYY